MVINLEEYYTELGGMINHTFRRNYFLRYNDQLPAQMLEFQKKCHNTDCFQCLYKYDSLDKEKPLLYAPFYLDLDADIASEKKFKAIIPYVARAFFALQNLGLTEEDIQLYFSGSKGFHIIIDARVLGIIPSEDLNTIYKAWALYFTKTYAIPIIDLRIYDKRRLFRIPNTINGKTGLYKVPIQLSYLFEHTYADLLEYASQPKQENKRIYKINRAAAIAFYNRSKHYKLSNEPIKQDIHYEIPETKQQLLPCIQTILEEGAIQGTRNNTLIILASGLLQSGYKMEEVEKIALSWNCLNEPPLYDSEVLTTIHSAYIMLQNGRRYGCASIKEMGLCSDNECRIRERINYGN